MSRLAHALKSIAGFVAVSAVLAITGVSEANAQVNSAPTANAGDDQTVAEGAAVTLDGSDSSDPESETLTYLWTAPTGITLSSTTVASPTFTAPSELLEDTELTFSLTVNDGNIDSAPATVTVTVTAGNNDAPIADAGMDQSVTEGEPITTVMLDGGGSYDPEGQTLTYIWDTVGTPKLFSGLLRGSRTATPEFSLGDGFVGSTTYTLRLGVSDGVTTVFDEVSVTVTGDNDAPIAGATTATPTVAEGATVTLSVRGSYDPERQTLSYLWTAPTEITLSDPTVARPTFTAPQVMASGVSLTFTLVVNDGNSDSIATTVIVTVLDNVPPIAVGSIAPLALTADGATASRDVAGNFSDTDDLTYTAVSADTDTATVVVSGSTVTVTPVDEGSTTITVTATDTGGATATQTFTLTIVSPPPPRPGGGGSTNTAPVADAGEPQAVAMGTTVTLDGRGSSDPDSDSLSYAWSQTDNDAPRVTLHGANTARPSFTAPSGPSAAAVLEFSLTVRDRSLSSTDTVAITVQANEAPAADAGNPQTVAEGAMVTLSGSGTDPDGDDAALSYAWSQTDNDAPRVTLRDADTATPSFTAPSELSAAAVLVFSLTVSDGNLSNTATVTITVTQLNEAPAADAGDPQTVDEGATVSLDGRGSSDADGDSLSYAWSQTDNGAPRVTLRGADTATPGFTAPSLLSADAVLKFSLSVSDGKLSTTATVTITVIYVNDAPDADAGAPQTVAEGATVTLSGSGTDPDGEDAALSYAWSQTDNGAARVSLRGANTATPSFTAPSRLSAAAVLDFTLTVTDAPGATGTGQVQITVATDVAARQQALEVTLAAFGRSVATGAVDAIGHRLRPASTEVRTSRLGGSSLAACAASAPADAADTARAAGTTATPWPNPNGNDNDNSLTDNRAGASCRLPSRAQLAQSTFLMSLNGLSETATAGTDTEGWSLWGRGDLSRFEGRPQHEFSLDGEVMAGYLGLDYRLESGGLVGLALSRSSGDIDYRSGAAEGELDIDLNTVYPYGYWSPHAGLSLWGLLGIGHGDATLTHSATAFETDLDMRMGALGARQALHAAGGFELALKADAFMVELDSDAELGLPAVTAQASRARLMLEGRSTWQVQPDARLSTSVELGARADGGDADEGAGIEMGAGVEYDNTRLGLSAALRVQGLLAHQQSGFEEWGASLNIRLDPGVPGRGLALALTPEWGQASSGGAAQALWESDRALQNAGLAQRPSAQLDLDLSYGMNGMTQLTPFAKLALADGIARHLRMGLRVERADGLALEFFAGRNASTYSAPELLLGLSGRLRF